MTQAAWLLEWPADDNLPSRYWHPKTGWMLDPHKACWFAREADAAGYKAASVMHGIIRPVEHVFGIQRYPTEAEKKAQGARCGCGGVDDYCPCQNVVQP